MVMEAANPGTYKIEPSPEGAAEGRAHVVRQQEEPAEGRADRWRQGRPSDPSSTGTQGLKRELSWLWRNPPTLFC